MGSREWSSTGAIYILPPGGIQCGGCGGCGPPLVFSESLELESDGSGPRLGLGLRSGRLGDLEAGAGKGLLGIDSLGDAGDGGNGDGDGEGDPAPDVVFVDPTHIALLSVDYAHQKPLKAKLRTTVISVQLHSPPEIDEPAPVDIMPAAGAAPFADPLLAECPKVFIAPSVAEVVASVVAGIVFDAPFVDMLLLVVVISDASSLPEVIAPVVVAINAPIAFHALIAFDVLAADAMLAVAIQPAI